MKRTGVTLALAIVFGVGFIAGRGSNVSLVCIELTNRGSTLIRKATVKHKDGAAEIRAIAPGASASIQFFAHGETSFRTTVEFDNGRLIEGVEQYAEPGYRFVTVARDDVLEESLNY